MAIRTTDVAVQGIIEQDVNIPLTPFIEVASSLVDEIVAVGVSYDATREELVERWLSAHFYAIRDPRARSERAGPVSASYFGKTDLGLNVTRYGQMAIVLDTSGQLANISKSAVEGKSRSVGVSWLGTADSKGNDTST